MGPLAALKSRHPHPDVKDPHASCWEIRDLLGGSYAPAPIDIHHA